MFSRPRQPEEQHPSSVTDARDAAEMVSRTGADDARAFEAIIRRHNRLLFRAVRGIVDDDDEAQDVVQDAHLLAFTGLHSFHGDASHASCCAPRWACKCRATRRPPFCLPWRAAMRWSARCCRNCVRKD